MARFSLRELEKLAWAEFQRMLDDYIEQYTKELRRIFLKSRKRRSSQARAAADG